MAYVTQRFGCAGGRGCGCASCGCRSQLGEWYVRDDDDDERPAPTAKSRRPAPRAPRAAPGTGALSGLAWPPALHPRCNRLSIRVPGSYPELETAVRNWIATCVMSRTVVDGAPIRR